MEFLEVSGSSGIEIAPVKYKEPVHVEILEYILPYTTVTHGVQIVYNTASMRIGIFYIYDDEKVMIDTLEPKQMADYVRWSDNSWSIVGCKRFIEN